MDKILTIRKDYDDGGYSLIQELNSENHGWWISFNADNSRKWERFYLFGKKNGPERGWYDNGVLEYERSFKDDLLNGPWKTFYENGQLKNDAWFTNGDIDLFSKWYNSEGKLVAELMIIEGVKDGTEIVDMLIDEATFKTVKAIVTYEHGDFMGYETITF